MKSGSMQALENPWEKQVGMPSQAVEFPHCLNDLCNALQTITDGDVSEVKSFDKGFTEYL